MIVWLLVYSLGSYAVFTVPNIASEQACKALADQMTVKRPALKDRFECHPYEAARH